MNRKGFSSKCSAAQQPEGRAGTPGEVAGRCLPGKCPFCHLFTWCSPELGPACGPHGVQDADRTPQLPWQGDSWGFAKTRERVVHVNGLKVLDGDLQDGCRPSWG